MTYTQPTVPNKVEALDALPVGTVLRGDAREEGVIVAHLTCLGWTEGEVPYDSTRLLFRHADLLGIDSAGAVDAGGGLMSTKALEALPVGTVIRIDTRAYVHTAAWEWVETVTGTAYAADELDAEAIIIYQPKETK